MNSEMAYSSPDLGMCFLTVSSHKHSTIAVVTSLTMYPTVRSPIPAISAIVK